MSLVFLLDVAEMETVFQLYPSVLDQALDSAKPLRPHRWPGEKFERSTPSRELPLWIALLLALDGLAARDSSRRWSPQSDGGPTSRLRGFDIWVMLAATLLLVVFAATGWRVNRWEGAAFLLAYLGCLVFLLSPAGHTVQPGSIAMVAISPSRYDFTNGDALGTWRC